MQDKVHRRRRVLIGLGHSQREHAVGKFDALDRGLRNRRTGDLDLHRAILMLHPALTGRGRAILARDVHEGGFGVKRSLPSNGGDRIRVG